MNATTLQPQTAREPDRLARAYQAYVLARYEWFRLRAIRAGFKTKSGHEPLPLVGHEPLADIARRQRALTDWLKANETPEGAAASTVLPEPKPFEMPEGARRAACKSCGATMFWVQTQAGKMAPLNPDGTSHFSSCPNARAHRAQAPKAAPQPKPQAALWDGDNDSPTNAREVRKNANAASEAYGNAAFKVPAKPDLRPLWAAIHAANLPSGPEHRQARIDAVNARLRADDRLEGESFKGLSECAIRFLIHEIETGALSWK